MQAIESHGSDGDRERLGPIGRMEKDPQVTRKPSGPTGRMEIEKGVVESHRSDGEGSTSTSDTQAIRSHKSDGHGERPHRYT